MKLRLQAVLFSCAVFLVACSGGAPSPEPVVAHEGPPGAPTVLFYLAAPMKGGISPALKRIGERLSDQGLKVTWLVAGASGFGLRNAAADLPGFADKLH